MELDSANTTAVNPNDHDTRLKNIWGMSTHQYLFPSNSDVGVPLVRKIAAYCMIICQLLIYIGITWISSQKDRREVSVVANIGNSHAADQRCFDIGITEDDFYCNGNAGSSNFVAVGAANMLVLVFMTPDIVKAIANFQLGIVGSLLIIIEGIGAMACTVFLIATLPYDSDSLDIVLSAVGVAFVHDMDEKFYDAIRFLKSRDVAIYLGVIIVLVFGGAGASLS